jgi:dTDP-4-dehydrorhamnose 3,5-epimerase
VTKPQGKVRVVSGSVYDVAVDLRTNSKTFGHWFGLELSAENKLQLWIPPGFGHAFLTLKDNTELLYKTTEFYFQN